ncbi:MAG: response regulator [Desulfobulbaceae bacterium]|nr:response regulator [Desulfobulbaceae bacterium]
MIVEDEFLIASDIKMSLEEMGFAVTSIVAFGEEAKEKAEEERPDVVLMDIHLRGEMDGIEAADQIYSELRIPVIFLTAYSDENLIKRARTVGSFGYLLKPFDDRELPAMIEMAVYRAEMEAEREQLIAELKQALAEIETLRGIIPICSVCKKIRNDTGYWQQVDAYVQEHTLAKFSHGYCPDCGELALLKLEEMRSRKKKLS